MAAEERPARDEEVAEDPDEQEESGGEVHVEIVPGLADPCARDSRIARTDGRDSGVPLPMNTKRLPRPGRLLDRFPLLGSMLIAATALVLAACNNSSGGTGY